MGDGPVRRASVEDAAIVAQLLHDFNTEFDTPTPGPGALESRLRELLAEDGTFALLAGDPPCGLALVTLRTNVWYRGPVALLDELYVAPAQRDKGLGTAMMAGLADECVRRGVELVEVNVDEGDLDALRFYGRHGFALAQPDTGERAFYLSRELPASG
jgi:GNAT superfamily N-acetyltransferase